jgi:hypothetical protein
MKGFAVGVEAAYVTHRNEGCRDLNNSTDGKQKEIYANNGSRMYHPLS